MWTDVSISVAAIINSTKTQPQPTGANHDSRHPHRSLRSRVTDPRPPQTQPPFVRVCGGCGDTSIRGLSYGCDSGCCFQLSEGGNWSLGAAQHGQLTGVVKGWSDSWHRIGVQIAGGALSATLNGACRSVPGVRHSLHCALDGLDLRFLRIRLDVA